MIIHKGLRVHVRYWPRDSNEVGTVHVAVVARDSSIKNWLKVIIAEGGVLETVAKTVTGF